MLTLLFIKKKVQKEVGYLICEQEEADDRIMYHINHAVTVQYYEKVASTDTDIFMCYITLHARISSICRKFRCYVDKDRPCHQRKHDFCPSSWRSFWALISLACPTETCSMLQGTAPLQILRTSVDLTLRCSECSFALRYNCWWYNTVIATPVLYGFPSNHTINLRCSFSAFSCNRTEKPHMVHVVVMIINCPFITCFGTALFWKYFVSC